MNLNQIKHLQMILNKLICFLTNKTIQLSLHDLNFCKTSDSCSIVGKAAGMDNQFFPR